MKYNQIVQLYKAIETPYDKGQSETTFRQPCFYKKETLKLVSFSEVGELKGFIAQIYMY